MAKTTWKAWNGENERHLPASAYAFPHQKIDPLIDATLVRSALEHFDKVCDVSDAERTQAFDNIKKAASHFHVEIYGDTYEEMCRRPQVEFVPRD